MEKMKPAGIGIGVEQWRLPLDPKGKLMPGWGLDAGIIVEDSEVLPDGTRLIKSARLVEVSLCRMPDA